MVAAGSTPATPHCLLSGRTEDEAGYCMRRRRRKKKAASRKAMWGKGKQQQAVQARQGQAGSAAVGQEMAKAH